MSTEEQEELPQLLMSAYTDERLRTIQSLIQEELNRRAVAALDKPSLRAVEPGTCPRRMNDLGPWQNKEGLDGFDAEGRCVFCGGISLEEFEGYVAQALDPESPVRLDISDRAHKVYVHGTDKEGCVKFYSVHGRQVLQDDKEWEEHAGRVHQALQASWPKHEAKAEELGQQIKEDLNG